MHNYRFRGVTADGVYHGVAAGPVTACGEEIKVQVGAEDADVTCVDCLKRMAHEIIQQIEALQRTAEDKARDAARCVRCGWTRGEHHWSGPGCEEFKGEK